MSALSQPYWEKVLRDTPQTPSEREFARFALDLLERAGDHPAVEEYLTNRARRALAA